MKICSFLLPFWYPFSVHKLNCNEIYKNTFFENEYVMYKNSNDSIIVHSNTCPHQGGRFSNGGFLSEEKNIVCPYHGFCFENGTFIGICYQPKLKFQSKKQSLTTFEVKETDDMIFIHNNQCKEKQQEYEIYYPPEEYNPTFRAVSGWVVVSNNYLTVTENLLDMLHISFVHSFGNKFSVPDNIEFERLSEFHGRTSFVYSPSTKSLGTLLSKSDYDVKVENEFILPTNTITRVFIGDSIKTVFTRSIPIDENKTLLYWKLYRNFYTQNWFFEIVGDFFVKYLMKKVIQEDIKILKDMNVDDRNGPVKTPYDKTILEFRKSMKNFMKDLE